METKEVLTNEKPTDADEETRGYRMEVGKKGPDRK
jgi:hypothetical protein